MLQLTSAIDTRVFRVDHYFGKHTAVGPWFTNRSFEPLLTRDRSADVKIVYDHAPGAPLVHLALVLQCAGYSFIKSSNMKALRSPVWQATVDREADRFVSHRKEEGVQR